MAVDALEMLHLLQNEKYSGLHYSLVKGLVTDI